MRKLQKLLTDEQWELVEPMLPPPQRRPDNRGRPWGIQPSVFRAYAVDPANWCGVAVLARGVSFASDLLEAVAAMGTARGLAQRLAHPAGRAEHEEGLLKWDETFLDGSFAPAEKGLRSGENQAG
jgi:hypothetical protein